MDPLTRKLFQPREAREKLRGMGGIMSSSPQLASTVAKYQSGGDVAPTMPRSIQQLVAPAAPDQSMSMAGRPRATRIGDRTYLLTEDGRVLDAATGAPAPMDVAAAVRSRLIGPQPVRVELDSGSGRGPVRVEFDSGSGRGPVPYIVYPDGRMTDAEFGFELPDTTTYGPLRRRLTDLAEKVAPAPNRDSVNPSYTEDRPDRFAEISDLPPMSGPAGPTPMPVSPELESERFLGDLGLMFGDRRERQQAPAPAGAPEETAGRTLSEALANRPGIRGLGQSIADSVRLTAETVVPPELVVGERPTPPMAEPMTEEELQDYSRQAADTAGVTIGPGAGLEPIDRTNLLPPQREPTGDAGGDAGDGGGAGSGGAGDLDLNDPATFDTTYDQMLTRLQRVMGTKDENSREKAMANLAMIGLAIAAGQSPNALTNIAQGALTGVKAIREEKAAREEQDKALRMSALSAALEQEQGVRSAEADAARDELKFQRDIALEQVKAGLRGGSGRDPRAIEDFIQNVYTEALKAATGVAPPPDMLDTDTPEVYAERKANASRLYMQTQFPNTYGGAPAGGAPAGADDLTEEERLLLEGE